MIIQNKKLQQKILKMFNKDQKLRKLAIDNSQNKKLFKKVYEMDGQHLGEIKKIIKKYGWPTFNLVGKRASNGFWALIQHADRDLDFQKKCLKLLSVAAKKGQVKMSNVAYLTDRIRAAEGKKIKFGTQYLIKNGKPIIKPVMDLKNLEKLRKQYGMETIVQQTKRIKREYAKLLKASIKK